MKKSPSLLTQVGRFFESDETVRRKKLEVILHLEMDKTGLSFLERVLLWWLSFILRVTVRRGVRAPNPAATNDRTSLPTLNLAECGDTFHFGGSLQSDETMPQNYVSTTAHLDSRQNCILITRMMLSYIEMGGLSRNVADATFVLAGDNENELPERALCTSRTVRASLPQLPMSSLPRSNSNNSFEVDNPSSSMNNRGIASLMLKLFVTDPIVSGCESIIRSVVGIHHISSRLSPNEALHPNLQSYCNDIGHASVKDSVVDPFQKAINKLISILEGISVPVKTQGSGVDAHSREPHNTARFDQVSILRIVDRNDIIRFFIASKCCPKTASVRIVESAIWRGMTFPVDTRMCRIELQTGQFFHQGFDFNGNPVFYFRNLCLGPWRKDHDAVIAAVLHRLEMSLSQFSRTNPFVQCTLIVLAGRPYRRKNEPKNETKSPERVKSNEQHAKDERNDQVTIASTAISTLHGTEAGDQSNEEGASVVDEDDSIVDDVRLEPTNNPRVFPDEHWNVHTSKVLIGQLVHVLLSHYPERLSSALVVIGHGNNKYARSAVGGLLYLTGLVNSSRTRDKVRFLTRYRDLQSYVHHSQLITLVGGSQVEDPHHYECR
jgi:hypothetical protein